MHPLRCSSLVLLLLLQAGIVFWSETIGPSVSSDNCQDWDFFMKYQLQQLAEMMDNALNHAAVMTWGWFNEGALIWF